MKDSIYNNYVQFEKGLMIYNALTQKIVYLEDFNESLLSSCNTFTNDDSTWLKRNGFIVDDKFDELQEYFLVKQKKKYDSNLIVTLIPTNDCNFFCKYCYEKKNSDHFNEDIINGFIDSINNNIDEYESINIKWFGGEPLLRKQDIYDISTELIKIAIANKKPYISSICTNGYLLDLDTFKKLLNKRVVLYQVSLAGLKEIHDTYIVKKDGSGTFDRIVDNLLAIKNNIKVSNFTIIIRTNVTKSLLKEFDKYLAFLNKHFGDDKRFVFVFRAVQNCELGDSTIDNNEIVTEDEVYEHLLTAKTKLNYSAYFDLLKNDICDAARKNSYSLTTNGSIIKCKDIDSPSINTVGKIHSVGKIEWYNNTLNKWIQAERTEKCLECSFKPSCSICPADCFISGTNNTCIITNNQISKVLKLFYNDLDKYKNFIKII